jgi:hypothetical protein
MATTTQIPGAFDNMTLHLLAPEKCSTYLLNEKKKVKPIWFYDMLQNDMLKDPRDRVDLRGTWGDKAAVEEGTVQGRGRR